MWMQARTPWLLRFGTRFISSSFSRKPLENATTIAGGDKLSGYTVNNVTEIPELDLVAVQLTHDKTGAKHLHIARDDSNNTFGVGFRTIPMDSTGVAHILEHTVLCGSQKYPVRDPFFRMLNRSLATSMNAYTANDWTLYPFSTHNMKDYYNLMSVYMDSVFYPQLRELDFRQEGWRIEHEDPNDQDSPILFKGVVFNEMKGVFASPENVYEQLVQNLLYPSHTYSHVSGGHPLCILDLTWEQLKKFHSLHYHPTNARFFTYGNFPLHGHLEYIDSVLRNFKQAELCTEVPIESRWTEPREQCTVGPVDAITKSSAGKSFVGISFLLSPITDSYFALMFSVLSQLLVDGPVSPFYQSLIESNMGSEYTPDTGYDSSTKESSFSVGLQAVTPGDVDTVKHIIWDTLERVSREGFTESHIKSVLHQIELKLKHQTSNFGLSLLMGIISPWIHDGNPADFLLMNRNIERCRKESQDDTYWKRSIEKYLLNNNHCLTLVMTMSEQYKTNMLKREKERKHEILSSLSGSQKKHLYIDGLKLIEDQDHGIQQVDCMPSLHLSDVSSHIQPTILEHDYTGDVPVQYSEQPTNNVTYFRALSGITSLPDSLKVYIPLFCTAVTQVGTEYADYRQFSLLCDQYTGGLNASSHVCPYYNNLLTVEEGILFSSYCLNENLSFMFNLWEELFCSCATFDEERLRTILNVVANNAAMNVPSRGHLFAIRSASSGLTPTANMSEIFMGLTQVQFLKDLCDKGDLSDLVHKLMSIAAEVFNRKTLRVAINTNTKALSTVQKTVDKFVGSLPGKYEVMSSLREEADFVESKSEMKYHLNLPVNYTAYAIKTVPYHHKDSPSLEVLAKLMTTKFLHKEIREKGGAYGAGVMFSDGIFSFYSYRDPHSEATLSSYNQCIRWVLNGDFTEEDMVEAKLSVFAQLDFPVSAGSKGSLTFLNHVTPEMQSVYRRRVFEVSKQDLLDVTARYMLHNAWCGSAVIC